MEYSLIQTCATVGHEQTCQGVSGMPRQAQRYHGRGSRMGRAGCTSHPGWQNKNSRGLSNICSTRYHTKPRRVSWSRSASTWRGRLRRRDIIAAHYTWRWYVLFKLRGGNAAELEAKGQPHLRSPSALLERRKCNARREGIIGD